MQTATYLTIKGILQILKKLEYDLIIAQGKVMWDICVINNDAQTIFFESIEIDSKIDPKGKLFLEYPDKIRMSRAIRYAYANLARRGYIPSMIDSKGIDIIEVPLKYNKLIKAPMETTKYRVTLEFDIYIDSRDNEGDLKDIADVHTQAKFKAQAMANKIPGSAVTIKDIESYSGYEMKSINS